MKFKNLVYEWEFIWVVCNKVAFLMGNLTNSSHIGEIGRRIEIIMLTIFSILMNKLIKS